MKINANVLAIREMFELTTVTFTGTTQQLTKAKKTYLSGVKVKHKQISCFYCNCIKPKLCGCTCHRNNGTKTDFSKKRLPRVGW